MYRETKVSNLLSLLFILASDVLTMEIITEDHDAINKSNFTACFHSNDALETNALSEEIKSVDGQRFYGFLAKIGWTSETGKVSFHCGGTLISETYVLSVGHCMEYERPNYKSQPDIVRIAERPFEGNVVGEDIHISSITIHPLYGLLSMYDDIALIELKKPSMYRPACIWTSLTLPITDIFALGHDLIKQGTQEVMSLKFVSTDDCDRLYSPSRKLPNGIINSQFCAGNSNITDGEKCKGFIGGPLLTQAPNNSEEFVIVGLTNFGKRCSSSFYPNIYTKLSFYHKWIEETIDQSLD